MTRARRIVMCGVLVVTAFGLSGCKGATDAEKRVREALRNTEKLSNTFLYQETVYDKAGKHETDVRGLVEDDFRYKARVATDGKPVLDEVVSDDALAVRFLDPASMERFLRKPTTAKQGGSGVGGGSAPEPVADGGGSSATPGEPAAAAILASKRWVLDSAGAPAAFATANTDQKLGDDPIADSRAVFAYVDRAINEAVRVTEWNPESLEYRADEDPFETPKAKSGVARYDFEPPNLPKASETGSGANQVTPEARHFRKMSVYVKDKRIIRVVEKIDVESRLDDLEKIYDTKFPKDRSPAEVAVVAVEALNVIRTGQGQDPIRMRDMEFSLKDLGTDVKVDMPTDTMKGSLALLANRGRPADAANGVLEAAEVRAQAQAAAAAGGADQAAAPPPADQAAPPPG
ncbi:MAG TPA: hypothetical protein VJS45_09950 [Acidimicrobiia bacterium]|nr:hypothetical protein [Acidimicrobiia bacterium]